MARDDESDHDDSDDDDDSDHDDEHSTGMEEQIKRSTYIHMSQ